MQNIIKAQITFTIRIRSYLLILLSGTLLFNVKLELSMKLYKNHYIADVYEDTQVIIYQIL